MCSSRPIGYVHCHGRVQPHGVMSGEMDDANRTVREGDLAEQTCPWINLPRSQIVASGRHQGGGIAIVMACQGHGELAGAEYLAVPQGLSLPVPEPGPVRSRAGEGEDTGIEGGAHADMAAYRPGQPGQTGILVQDGAELHEAEGQPAQPEQRLVQEEFRRDGQSVRRLLGSLEEKLHGLAVLHPGIRIDPGQRVMFREELVQPHLGEFDGQTGPSAHGPS